MKHYLVTAKITIGELEQSEQVLVEAANERHARQMGYESVRRGPLESTDSGYFDMGGEIHLEVTGTQEVPPHHLPILQHYLLGKPLPEHPRGGERTYVTHLQRSILKVLKQGPMTADKVRQALGQKSVENVMSTLKRMTRKGVLDVEKKDVISSVNQPRSLNFYSIKEVSGDE